MVPQKAFIKPFEVPPKKCENKYLFIFFFLRLDCDGNVKLVNICQKEDSTLLKFVRKFFFLCLLQFYESLQF